MSEAIELLKKAEANFINLYNAIAPSAAYEGGNNFADKDEVVLKIREFLVEEDKADYITIYKSISGWTAVHIYWNVDGFWEPWTTGIGKYADSEGAEKEARSWAEAEELPYVHPRSLD